MINDGTKPKRGRPPGSRNKTPEQRLAPPSTTPRADYKHTDISAMVERQLALIDWAQQAVRNEMQKAMQQKGEWVSATDTAKLEKLSMALLRALEAMKKADDLESLLSDRMSGEELLEAAFKKIEGQDIATINYGIRRLRAYRDSIAKVKGIDKLQMGEATASDAIAELDEDD